MVIRLWLLLCVVIVPVVVLGGEDEIRPESAGESSPAATQPADVWAQLNPKLRAGLEADAEARGLTLEAALEKLLLQHLADSMADAYRNLTDLSFESRVSCSERPFKPGAEVDLSFDEALPEVARVKCWMKPNQQMRAEAFIAGEEVWGIVSSDSTRSPGGRAIVVQWTDTEQTKPYRAGPDGAVNNFRDDQMQARLPVEATLPGGPSIAGKCLFGEYLRSCLPGADVSQSTWITAQLPQHIVLGTYDGIVPTVDGRLAHRISRVFNKGLILYRWYLDPQSLLVIQRDKRAAVECLLPTRRIVATVSQRWTYGDISTKSIADERFQAPATGDRTLVDFGPPVVEEGGADGVN